MTVFLGKLDYSPYKGFAPLEADFTATSGDIDAIEICIKKHSDGDGFVVFMAAKSISSLWKPETFKAGSLVFWHIHAKQYTRWTKENPKLPTEPTPLEKTWIKFLESEKGSSYLDKPFSGKMSLASAESILEFVADKQQWELLAKLSDIPELTLLKEIPSASAASGGSKRGGSYGQKESERLQERFDFIKKMMGSYGDDCDDLVTLSAGILAFKNDTLDKEATSPESPQYDIATLVLEYLVGFTRVV
jgi:hypothetical protein